jgi:signal transduction histidine kinase
LNHALMKFSILVFSAFSAIYYFVVHYQAQTGTTLIGIGAIASPIMIFALGVLQLWSTRRAEAARIEVAAKVEEAKSAANEVAKVAANAVAQAAEQSSKILVLADKTHTLVNSQYGIALALILEKAIRIANMSNLPEDIRDVEKARQKLAEHEAKQHVVDSKEDSAT